ncbi:hypothetical protein BaRGS_00038702 [Batillaria attramentaria]|uniref:Uncharacterized protein n=1 Tax=Batillaria attramentaria TaxID=370345 RepID=A0ABD0J514_9CAEN
MSEQLEEDDDCKDLSDLWRLRVPSKIKKKFEDELETVRTAIRATAQELESLKASENETLMSEELKGLRADRIAVIDHRKQVDSDLQKLNKEKIPVMARNLSRLEPTLYYKNDDRINEAIRRLEYNIQVQNFRLSEEKKIVAEIDRLRRSKKTLVWYQALKQEMAELRNEQRRLREERDHYFRRLTELNKREDAIKRDSYRRRVQADKLKKELDSMYESKRQLIANYRKQREDHHDDTEKRRHEERDDEKADEKREMYAILSLEENFPPQKLPFGDEICLCNTLIHYLNRFVSNTDLDPNPPEVRVTFAEPSDSAPVSKEESAGQGNLYRLNLHSSVGLFQPVAPLNWMMVKRITHTPEVLSQFSQLNLQAPASAGEVLASLEQLNARKLYYEREAEVRSEAELSVTESAIHEMSRQASHTESSDEVTESNPGDSVVEQLLERADLRDNAAEGQTPDKLALPEWDCFRNWHSAKEKQPSDAETLTPPSDLDEPQPRTRSEGSDSTPPSSSTVEGACGGVEGSTAIHHGQTDAEKTDPGAAGTETARVPSTKSETLAVPTDPVANTRAGGRWPSYAEICAPSNQKVVNMSSIGCGDSEHANSRSEGSKSIPPSSSALEGACGGMAGSTGGSDAEQGLHRGWSDTEKTNSDLGTETAGMPSTKTETLALPTEPFSEAGVGGHRPSYAKVCALSNKNTGSIGGTEEEHANSQSQCATYNPLSPRFAMQNPASPRFATQNPASPQLAAQNPTSPWCGTENPKSPWFATQNPLSPRLTVQNPTSPRQRPTSPRFATQNPTSPRFAKQNPLSPRLTVQNPTSPRQRPTSPRFATQNPTPPRFATQNPTSPRFATQNPISPQFATQNPTPPRFAMRNPTSPRFATQNPASPRFATQNPTSPRFATQNPTSPRFAIRNPTSPRFATQNPTSPRFAT